MNASPPWRGGGHRSEPGRRPDGPARTTLPRRNETPLRKPDPNLRRADGVVREPTLAVDLGTSGSSAVLLTPDREYVVEDPHLGHAVWPSAVAHDGVAPRVGGAAENYARVHPDAYVDRLKQLLPGPAQVPVGEGTFRSVELVSWLFAAMRAQGERVSGFEVVRAVVAAPVGGSAEDPRRAGLIEACRLAGLVTVEFVAESLATLSAPLVGGPFAPGDMVLVADLGAGGFTGALVSLLKSGDVELLAHREDPTCSGQEMDRLLVGELLARAGRTWNDLATGGDEASLPVRQARARRGLVERARAVKHQLSVQDSAVELVGPDEVPVEITAEELAALVAPMLYQAVDGFREVLQEAGVRPGELAAVLLSGGGSRMPAVADVVTETFHRPIRTTLDPHRAVSEGAARFARHSERRHVRARVATERETPLRWDLPAGGTGELHWLIAPGTRFGASDALATVRLPDGALWELRSGRTGTLIRTHAADGARVCSGDWLVTVELDVRPFR